jgi:transposase
MILERLNDPVSKRSNHQNQKDYIFIEEMDLPLHPLYRSLDYLEDNSEKVRNYIYSKGRNLFNSRLDLVFYEVTTFYFESSKEEEGSIRQKGFSKDGKIGKTQVVFGLLIDNDKHPLDYYLYEG